MIIFTGLKFNKNFRKNADGDFEKKQKYVDSEVLRYSDKYTPKRNGKLIESGISGTVTGSGKIEYTAPYGRKQYYENAGKGVEGMNRSGGGLRGKMWFERMKADHKKRNSERTEKNKMKSIIESVREFIMQFPKLKDGALLVDFLENSPISYTVEPVPHSPVAKKFIDGSCEKQFLFLFASREFYSDDVNTCIENLSFYEDFADWIHEQNDSGNFPVLSGKRTVTELEILTGGYQFSADTSTARYQIQMRLIYREN